jgi:hypothetical protein
MAGDAMKIKRKRIDELLDAAFLTGGASTTTTTTVPQSTLALDAYLKMRDAMSPVVFYMVSEHVESTTAVYQIPNDQARAGYDLVCHPNCVAELEARMAGVCRLRPIDAAEWRRRSDEMARKMLKS